MTKHVRFLVIMDAVAQCNFYNQLHLMRSISSIMLHDRSDKFCCVLSQNVRNTPP
jgi:hypothetical protein